MDWRFWRWKTYQKNYDEIKGWNWSSEMAEKIRKINDMLPEKIADAILAYLKNYYKLGEDSAKRSLEILRNKIDQVL